MGRKALGQAGNWSMALVRATAELRQRSGLTNQEIIERTRMSSSYYYARLRGDAPFDTNDIEKLASALGVHPHEISRLAASREAEGKDFEPRVETEPLELARRLQVVGDAPLADGSPFLQSDLLLELDARGISGEPGEWEELLTGSGGRHVRARVLETVASYSGLPPEYLLHLSDADAVDSAEAQIDFRRAFVETGAHSISARATGGVSPGALRAIAQSLRSIPPR